MLSGIAAFAFMGFIVAYGVVGILYIRASRRAIDLMQQYQPEKWVALGRPSMGMDGSFISSWNWTVFLTKGQFEDVVDTVRAPASSARRSWLIGVFLFLTALGAALVIMFDSAPN